MISKKLLVIDCQILQTHAFDRGMGKYTSSLLKSLSLNKKFRRKYEQVYLLLNSNLRIDKEYIESLVPYAKTVSLSMPTDIDKQTNNKIDDAEKTLSSFCDTLLENSNEISFLITAPFFVGFASAFPTQKSIKKFTLVYDFIPYRIWAKKKIFPDYLYFQHFRLFLEADGLFTISESVKKDLVEVFGFSENKVTSIDGGPFEQSIPENLEINPIVDKYIIYPSAPIIHKNNTRAVQGFKKFNAEQKNKYKLVITSTFDDETKKQLNDFSENLVFTGNISDQELYRYYHNSSALLFASLSEGLGMPILEAVHHLLPIACSDIPVLTEISENAMYLFDPTDIKSISKALNRAVGRVGFSDKLLAYKLINKKYNWNRSAKLLVDEIVKSPITKQKKMNLLVVLKNTNTENCAARFIEYIYAQLHEQFYVTLRLPENEKHTQKMQTYISYLGKQNAENKYDRLLNQKSKSLTLIVGSITKQIKFGKKNILNRYRKDIIYISAHKHYIDEPLGFKSWVYSVEDGVDISTAESIVNIIMDKFK